MTRRLLVFLSLLALPSSLLSSCGYQAGGLYDHKAVRLRIFDNLDERRTHEFDLTQAVARQLQADGIQVNGAAADVEIAGTIENVSQPTAVEGKQDLVVVGSVVFRLTVVVKDLASGRELRRDTRTETATFSTARAESLETARREAFDRLARWVASRLERDW